jgi:2-hydroxy-6-oxonona-2,4-dienedioate hydrolase
MNKAELFVAAAMPAPKWIEADGVSTCYFEAGSGEPVVLVHGGNMGAPEASVSAACWLYNIEPLSKHFHVVALDRLGQGYTEAPLRDEDYTMAASARHAAAFIKALGLPPVHLVGHSRGAYIAVRIALEHPELVRSVTIVSSGTLMPLIGTNENALMPCPLPTPSREAVHWVHRAYSFNPDCVTDDWVDMSYASVVLPEYQRGVRKMADEGLRNSLFVPALQKQKRETINAIREGHLQRPVQIFWGYNDRTATYEGGPELFRMIAPHERRTALHMLNEAGHFVFAEQPAQFNALLTRFIHAAAAEV